MTVLVLVCSVFVLSMCVRLVQFYWITFSSGCSCTILTPLFEHQKITECSAFPAHTLHRFHQELELSRHKTEVGMASLHPAKGGDSEILEDVDKVLEGDQRGNTPLILASQFDRLAEVRRPAC